MCGGTYTPQYPWVPSDWDVMFGVPLLGGAPGIPRIPLAFPSADQTQEITRFRAFFSNGAIGRFDRLQ